MMWRLLHNRREVARGTREHMLDTAETWGVLFHTRMGGNGKPFNVEGRGYYLDGLEIPPRLRGDFALMPVATGVARRCAA